MADVEIRDYTHEHALPCPSDIGELRKLIDGFRLACEREGRPIVGDDEVLVTVGDGAVVLTRVPL